MSDTDILELLKDDTSTEKPGNLPRPGGFLLPKFSLVVYHGGIDVCRLYIERKQKDTGSFSAPLEDTINELDRRTGLRPIHIAIGRNNLPMTQLLTEAGARYVPDGQGRMPSTIAEICEVSPELLDYVLEQEERVDTE
jgi:hypothetical protein